MVPSLGDWSRDVCGSTGNLSSSLLTERRAGSSVWREIDCSFRLGGFVLAI